LISIAASCAKAGTASTAITANGAISVKVRVIFYLLSGYKEGIVAFRETIGRVRRPFPYLRPVHYKCGAALPNSSAAVGKSAL
jgi:hypothetical protein